MWKATWNASPKLNDMNAILTNTDKVYVRFWPTEIVIVNSELKWIYSICKQSLEKNNCVVHKTDVLTDLLTWNLWTD